MSTQTLLIIGGVLAVVGFALYKWNLLGKIIDAIHNRAEDGVNSLSSPADRERARRRAEQAENQALLNKKTMRIEALDKLVKDQGGAVTDMDAEVATQTTIAKRLKKAWDDKVADLKLTPTASPGDVGALRQAATNVATAKAAYDTQMNLLDNPETGLKAKAKAVHDAYEDSLKVIQARKNELPEARAKVIMINAAQIQASISRQQEQFNEAAKLDGGEDEELDRKLNKAEAEKNLNGPSQNDRNLARLREEQSADAILAQYGLAPAAPATPSTNAAPPAGK